MLGSRYLQTAGLTCSLDSRMNCTTGRTFRFSYVPRFIIPARPRCSPVGNPSQIQVDGFIFKVPRYHFIAGSEYFATTYLHAADQAQDDWSTVSGESDSAPPSQDKDAAKGVVVLEDVTASQFRTFLKLLFPM